MMTFKKYSSIENTYDKDFLERVRLYCPPEQEFVVQEKVHGSNICLVTDGSSVHFGKRSGFVEVDEKFFDYEELLDRYHSKVVLLFSMVKKEFPDLVSLTLFGEMFGGRYPHPDVKNNFKTINIQKGVFYCPYHEFYAFDMYVALSDSSRFLSVDEANAFFELGGFFYAKTLMRGSLSVCLEYPNNGLSQIGLWLGLPPLEGNICEGVVIRPVVPT
ncbi:MAG: RNA ligase family protein, partial [Prevotellaceae bacterium]|nr:RNA ligase family protein [Prevotellaceae bacterium]